MSEAPPVYDAVELRRRIVVCFSIGELRQLSESLGVGGAIPWERGIHEAAREVVKQCERYAGLPALVARLREVRPLVEWPEPAVLEGPPSPTLTSAPEAAAQPEAAAVGATIADPFAPPAPPPGTVPFAPPLPPALPPVAHPAPPPPAPAAWPGVAPAQPAAARGLDARILVAVAGLMVVAAVVAYLAGRASSGPTTASAAPGSSAEVAAAAARADGPAALAADALSRSLANLARVCELPASAGADVLVFHRVFERCGPAPLPPRPAARVTPEAPPAPTAPADDAPPPDPARPRRPARGGDAATGEAPSRASGCMGACDADHRACKSRCGPEPTEASAYDAYNRCMGRCLTDASRCRLSCR